MQSDFRFDKKKIENFQKFFDFRTKQFFGFFKNQKLLLVSDTLSLDAPLVSFELKSSKEFYGAHYQ